MVDVEGRVRCGGWCWWWWVGSDMVMVVVQGRVRCDREVVVVDREAVVGVWASGSVDERRPHGL